MAPLMAHESSEAKGQANGETSQQQKLKLEQPSAWKILSEGSEHEDWPQKPSAPRPLNFEQQLIFEKNAHHRSRPSDGE